MPHRISRLQAKRYDACICPWLRTGCAHKIIKILVKPNSNSRLAIDVYKRSDSYDTLLDNHSKTKVFTAQSWSEYDRS